MEVVFNCPCCDREVEADAELGGGKAQCPGCNETILVPAAGIGEGSQVAGYKIVRQLGSGGMGEVFLATQVAMDRQVAFKVLPPAMTNDKDSVDRFLHEVRMAAKLEHPNIVTAFDAGEADGYYYLAMSYVEGEDLDDRISREGRLGERDALVICLEVAQALGYAWAKHKILHRDIKPANIMIDVAGDVKLMDMGIAKSLADESNLTMAGMYVGTPFYMSPEQCRAEKNLDSRSDIYSLGATAYHLVTGEKPFVAASSIAVLTAHLTQPLSSPRLLQPELSNAFDHLMTRMMAKDRDKRYASWEELIADLRVLLDAPEPANLKLPPLPDPLPVGGVNAEDNPPATIVSQLQSQATANKSAGAPALKPLEVDAPATDEPVVARGDGAVPDLKPRTEDGKQAPLPATPSLEGPAAAKLGDDDWASAVPPTRDRSINKAVAFAVVVLTLLLGAGGVFYLWQAAQDSEDDRVVEHQERQVEQDLEATAAVEGAIAFQQTRAEIMANAAEQERRIADMLNQAAAHEKANPHNPVASLEQYKAITRHAEGTKYELELRDHLARLQKQLVNAPAVVVANLQRQADELAQAWRFRDAAELVSEYQGPLAAQTKAERSGLAISYLATAELVEGSLAEMRGGVQAMAKLQLVPVRDTVVVLERQSRWRDEAMIQTAATGMRDLLAVGKQFFDSFADEAGKEMSLTINGREDRWRVRGLGDLRLRADLHGRTQALPLGAFSARDVLGRVPKSEDVGYQLLKAILASHAGRDDVVAKTLSGMPDGLLPRALAGELELRRAAGDWTGADGASLSLQDGSMRLLVAGRRSVGPVMVWAGQLLVLDGDGEINSRYDLTLAQDGNSLQLLTQSGERLDFRRGK